MWCECLRCLGEALPKISGGWSEFRPTTTFTHRPGPGQVGYPPLSGSFSLILFGSLHTAPEQRRACSIVKRGDHLINSNPWNTFLGNSSPWIMPISCLEWCWSPTTMWIAASTLASVEVLPKPHQDVPGPGKSLHVAMLWWIAYQTIGLPLVLPEIRLFVDKLEMSSVATQPSCSWNLLHICLCKSEILNSYLEFHYSETCLLIQAWSMAEKKKIQLCLLETCCTGGYMAAGQWK